jgi:hypothetical protein
MSDSIERKVDKILFYLESDPHTNQKGLVEQVEINTVDIRDIKEDKKITAGKITVAGVIFGAIGTILLKVFGLIKLVL